MEQEIHEQPRALARALEARLLPEQGRIELEGVSLDPQWLRTLSEIRIVGCGTAAHAGRFGSYLFESLAKLPARAELASELREREPLLGPRHWLVAISHSGETSETLAALRSARAQGCPTLAITSAPGSSLALEADQWLCTRSGIERAIPSTKGFTTQLVALYMLALEIARLRQTLVSADLERALRELAALPDLFEAALELWGPTLALARELHAAHSYMLVGRGLGHPIALEGALKLAETSYLPAEGQALGALRHGPIARVDTTTPVMLLAHAPEGRGRWIDLADELRTIGAPRIVVCARGDSSPLDWSEHLLRIPAAPEPLASMLAVMPLQMLAHHVARLRGNDVDRPRHLTKSVTDE